MGEKTHLAYYYIKVQITDTTFFFEEAFIEKKHYGLGWDL